MAICDRCSKPIITDFAEWMTESDQELEDMCQCQTPGFQNGEGMDARSWEPVGDDTDDTNSGQCVHGVGFDEGCELCDGYRDHDHPEG